MKVIYVDFNKQKVIGIEEITPPKDYEPDPILRKLKKQLDPKSFQMYKETIEHYMEQSFLLEMDERNKE